MYAFLKSDSKANECCYIILIRYCPDTNRRHQWGIFVIYLIFQLIIIPQIYSEHRDYCRFKQAGARFCEEKARELRSNGALVRHHGEVSSHFAQAGTDSDSILEPFRLEEAKYESSAHLITPVLLSISTKQSWII